MDDQERRAFAWAHLRGAARSYAAMAILAGVAGLLNELYVLAGVLLVVGVLLVTVSVRASRRDR